MIQINGQTIEPGYFPDGTLLIKYLPTFKAVNQIVWKFEKNEELISLYYLTRHMKELSSMPIELWMPYIPNARQDRIKKKEDLFTLKYFCEIINSLGYERVHVLDAHSSVAMALIDRVEAMDVRPYIEEAIKLSGISANKDILFYPDSGSQKRYSELITFPNAFGIKQRAWDTGDITGLEVSGFIPEGPFNALIIDDISSFGGTFYFSALKLKELGANAIDLYVTHCEDSILEGKLMEENLIRHIYTTSSLLKKKHEKITVLPICYLA